MLAQVHKRNFFLTYLKLGYLLHLMTLAEIILIVSFSQYFNIIIWLKDDFFAIKSLSLFVFIMAPVFPQCDARSRYQNYKQVKDHLYLYGFQPRIIKPFSFSRCQRDAVLAAAEELGMRKECAKYFVEQGHQWYHILPDFLYKKPQYLFKKAFWLNTFFAKYYQSKVNFNSITDTHKSITQNKNQFNFNSGSII